MVITDFETVIGLEIHVELATKTKLFCGCPNRFGGAPNTQVCPVCLGLPGVLPVANQEAVTLLLKAGLALGCKVPPKSKFDRKNYFYPDMPKNYQISQYDLPLTTEGMVRLEVDEKDFQVRIERIHLEEDTGKSIHVAAKDVVLSAEIRNPGIPAQAAQAVVGARIGQADYSLVDYNRAGVPLIEVVTRPDLRSPQEAVAFLQELRLVLQTVGVSECKMEEGRMRCDANVSIRPSGSETLGTKVEIKNMNSFKSVKDALTFEIERQKKAAASGEKIIQETRGWDEDRKLTFSMRSKEEAHDYRYFPEPDLPPFEIKQEWLDQIRSELPELPEAKRKRYREMFKLSGEEAIAITSNASASAYYDKASEHFSEAMKSVDAIETWQWMRGDFSRYLNEKGIDFNDMEEKFPPAHLVKLISIMRQGIISGKIAKEILPELLNEGEDPERFVRERGLVQISDEKELGGIVASVLADSASAKAVAEYRGGNDRAIGFLVGAVMKKTGGKANPALVNKLIKESLEKGG